MIKWPFCGLSQLVTANSLVQDLWEVSNPPSFLAVCKGNIEFAPSEENITRGTGYMSVPTVCLLFSVAICVTTLRPISPLYIFTQFFLFLQRRRNLIYQFRLWNIISYEKELDIENKLHNYLKTAGILTLRRLMPYIYRAPILDVSRSHTTTQHIR